MSKITSSVAVGLLVVGALGVGYWLGMVASAPKPPPTPRTPEEVAQSIELRGELRGLLLERNTLIRAARLSQRLTELGPEAAPTVAALLETGAIGLGTTEATLLTRFWAQYDPKAASDWAFSKASPPGVRSAVSETAAEVWAVADPAAARTAVQGYLANTMGEMSEALSSALLRGWFASGKPGLLEFIEAQDNGPPREGSMDVIIGEMIQRDGLEQTIEWVRALPEEDTRFKNAGALALARRLTQFDLQLALDWCKEDCDELYGWRTRATIARQWSREDRRAAMAWIATAPAGTERDRAVRDTFDDWIYMDLPSLRVWLDEIEPGSAEPWMFEIVPRIAMLYAFHDPMTAYQWAAEIPDDKIREDVMITITRRYREADDAGARAWLAESPLSEEARQRALTYPKGWKRRTDLPSAIASDLK